MNKTTIIALTVGPIYGSIQSARKVRELFGASYFFSWFMRLVLKELKNKEIHIYIPYTNKDLFNKPSAIGFFHDRFVAGTNHSVEEAGTLLDTAIKKAWSQMAEILPLVTTSDMEAFMTLHRLVLPAEALKQIPDKNMLEVIDGLLDAKELHYPFDTRPTVTFDYRCTQDEKELFETEIFEELSPANYFGYKLPHLKQELKISFDSFLSTVELSEGTNYYAVVTADGDKMGATIRELLKGHNDLNKLRELSKSLYEFFFNLEDGSNLRTLTNEIHEGELIFAGGDDILALLPVKRGDKTVFDYISTLSRRFKHFVGDNVSLSFGVNIVYQKYPMQKAIEEAFSLLKAAKKWREDEGISNVAKIQLVKHSGQTYDTYHIVESEIFKQFGELVKGVLNHKEEPNCTMSKPCFALPHAVHHTLNLYRFAIIQTLEDRRSLEALFSKIFDDERAEAQRKGLEILRQYIETLRPQGKKDFNRIYGDLNIVKFIRGDRDDLSD